jgi:hypothetical protein
VLIFTYSRFQQKKRKSDPTTSQKYRNESRSFVDCDPWTPHGDPWGAMGTHEDPMGTNGRAMLTQGDPMGTMGGEKSFFTGAWPKPPPRLESAHKSSEAQLKPNAAQT